nr:thymidine phosphorylase [archaeon]
MKLKIKNLDWLAGKPVAIISAATARKINVTVDERILLKTSSNKIYSIIDISSDTVKDGQIGLSRELTLSLKKKDNETVEISNSIETEGSQLIRKKLSGEKLSEKELRRIISELVKNNLSEAEIAFFIAAERTKGMTEDEIYYLTKAMVKEGKQISFREKIIADKHCIGGIAGNRTTPIVVAICAAAGLTIPKSSSRAITSAAGTADVIETMAKVDFSLGEIKRMVSKTNGCLVWGGALALAPSDDKIIAIERILNLDVEPQLLASIMAKKIAAGSNHILIDIPYGSGKIKNKKQGKLLGKKFLSLARKFNLKVKYVLTEGKNPIGKGIGPVLEMKDVISILKNEKNCPKDLKDKSIYLAAELMRLCNISSAKKKAKKILESGKAYEKFKEIINVQNGKDDFDKRLKNLSEAKFKKTIISNKSGEITNISNNDVNQLCRLLGTPQNPSAGIYLHTGVGKIKKGEN